MIQRFALCLVLLTSLSFSATAQKGWEAGGWLGVSYYFGDLNTSFDLSRPGLSAGVVGRYNFNERICIKFSANYGSVSADDAESDNPFERARNLSFQSVLADGTAQMEFNFFPYEHGSADNFYTPYLFAGLTAVYYNPVTEYEGELVELRQLGTEGQFKGEEYSQVGGGLAYGAGFKIDLSYRWSLNFEISGRRLFTDYLDDVSTVYADKDDIQELRGDLAVALSDRSILIDGVNDGEIGQPGRQRGTSVDNDSYVMLGIGLVYYFGQLRCPEYSR
ncbi:MAG: porin family protein [Bacteroidetes bacterium]|nr:porin family protein [Bacteroidota bacterium]